MELTQEDKDIVIKILSRADGEDMDEIVKAIGFDDYLLHSLIMRASDSDVEYWVAEKKRLHEHELKLVQK